MPCGRTAFLSCEQPGFDLSISTTHHFFPMNSNSLHTSCLANPVPVTSPDFPYGTSKSTTSPAQKRKRIRHSKLDPHFNLIATLILRRATQRELSLGRGDSLERIAALINKKTRVKVNKSTLCRFLKKHPGLNTL